jgi:hypothetical protein
VEKDDDRVVEAIATGGVVVVEDVVEVVVVVRGGGMKLASIADELHRGKSFKLDIYENIFFENIF